MAWHLLPLRVLRSLLAFTVAGVALVALSWAGGEAAPWVGLARGGDLRLGWDLAWLGAGGMVGFALVARLAPCAPRGHALALLAILLAAGLWAVATMGGDFPAWFSAGLIALLPLQCWLGLRLARPTPPALGKRRTAG